MHPFNTQIPLYIRHPDGPRGASIDAFVQSRDLMPVVLRLLDVPYANVDGCNAWALVTGEQDCLRDHVAIGWASFVTGNAGGRASVRDDEWNYVATIHEADPGPELYYLPDDPEERKNVHAKHPEVAAAQRRRLEAVVGQPLPAQLKEVCDPASPPMHTLLRYRLGGT